MSPDLVAKGCRGFVTRGVQSKPHGICAKELHWSHFLQLQKSLVWKCALDAPWLLSRAYGKKSLFYFIRYTIRALPILNSNFISSFILGTPDIWKGCLIIHFWSIIWLNILSYQSAKMPHTYSRFCQSLLFNASLSNRIENKNYIIHSIKHDYVYMSIILH